MTTERITRYHPMNPELSLLLGSIVGGTGALLSYWAGWRARGDVMRIRGGVVGSRRTTCGGGEITLAQWEAMGTRRGSNPPPPVTKPQFPPVRIISPDGTTIGYRSINYPDPSPDRRPTNPFSGEPVTLTESSVQRGNGNGGPTTSKPQPAGGRLITRTPFNESITQRGNGNGGPTTPKPEIVPTGQGLTKPQPPPGRLIGPGGVPVGYQPRPSRPGGS
jgi:hypothetical protein